MLVRLCSKSFKLGFNSNVNWELPNVQVGFRKGRGTRDQIANIPWIIGKTREFQGNIYFCFTDCTKAFDCVDYNKLWKILKVMGSDAIFSLWMLSFKPPFSLSSFTLIKKLFSSSSLSASRVVSFAYLRVLIIHPAILIPACDSPSLVFCMMYSAYKLNKQDDNIQPFLTPLHIWKQPIIQMSSYIYFILICIQISQEAGKVVWYSHLKNFPQFFVIHS